MFEFTSLNGLITIVVASVLIAVNVYAYYTITLSTSISSNQLPPIKELYSRPVLLYNHVFFDALGLALLVASPLASSLTIAYPMERREESFYIIFVSQSRVKSYIVKALSVTLWLAIPSTLLYFFIPISLSPFYGISVGVLALHNYLPGLLAYVSLFSASTILLSIVARRVGVAMLLGLLVSIAIKYLDLVMLSFYYLFGISFILWVVGYIVYSGRDI